MSELSPFENNQFIAMVNTLGQSVLVETLRAAAFYLNHSDNTQTSSRRLNTQMKEAKACYIFIQGTGLEMIINRYCLAYNADVMLEQFNYLVRHS